MSEGLRTTAYLAPRGFVSQLHAELGEITAAYDRLLLAPGPPRPIAWAANVWNEPIRIRIDSINQGARALREIQRNWVLYSYAQHRRASLIQDKLPSVSAKPLHFPDPPLAAPLGSWTLLDPHTILAAPRCSSAFPHGEVRFVEDRTTPPNRAYLKLWEVFTLIGERPGPGQVCVDLGSSPGGWTWVLQTTGASVISIDKAPLDPKVANLPGVDVRQESAFGIDPSEIGAVDWLFCDIACYPERLLSLVLKWIDSGVCDRMICTVKFQGETDRETTAALAAIPGSRLLHLSHNKHELTWVKGLDTSAWT